MYASSFLSPLGYMRACSSDTGLYALDWQQHPFSEDDHENDVSRETIKQIRNYLKVSYQILRCRLIYQVTAPLL